MNFKRSVSGISALALAASVFSLAPGGNVVFGIIIQGLDDSTAEITANVE